MTRLYCDREIEVMMTQYTHYVYMYIQYVGFCSLPQNTLSDLGTVDCYLSFTGVFPT